MLTSTNPSTPSASQTLDTTRTQKSLARWAIPWALLSVRVILTPLLLFSASSWSDRTILWLYLLAFVTDYLDGATARRFKTVTPLLRKSDGIADTFFHLAIALLIFRRHRVEFSKSAICLSAYLFTAAVWYVADAIRWHRLAGYHAYSAKLFSTGLMAWVIVLFGGLQTHHLLSVILILGTISNIECLLITAVLQNDRVDVPTLFDALRGKAG